MDDYERIARAIDYLVDHAGERPGLQALAAEAGLSPSHFQRKFSAWTGVSPKCLLQYLTLEHAREMLAGGTAVEQAAWASGLSGPGRLHDLCVSLEAATPGEIRRGGAGLRIEYGFGPTPFGECLIAESPRGICHLAFVTRGDRVSALRELQQDWPRAELLARPDKALALIEQVFNRQSPGYGTAPLRAYVRGTRFQLRIWRALLRIPEGQLISYGDMARITGQARAARAVGSAVGANRIAYLIPCHRVIRNSGIIGHYRWGGPRKQLLLSFEYERGRATR